MIPTVQPNLITDAIFILYGVYEIISNGFISMQFSKPVEKHY